MGAIILAIFAAAAAAGVTWRIAGYRRERLYREMDRMLDEILDGRPMEENDLLENELSALAGKAKRVQEKLEIEIGRAEKEKEQVKALISNMSHQLKTPLANILMYGELLEEGGLEEEQAQRFLKKLRNQSQQVDWILNSLFKMVKLEQNVIEFEAGYYPVRETMQDAIGRIYEKAQRKEIRIELGEFLNCNLYHNPKWTAEVFANLLENAVKYTPEKGRIEIEMHRLEMYTEIRIRDNGIGIRKEELIKIFGRFYRSSEVENLEGSGIGLYLSKLILEKEKGYMNVASEYGKGSCFSVFLQNPQL